MAGVQWNSLRDFAGFRGVERKPATGRLAVPPSNEVVTAVALSAADKVKQRLAALRGSAAPAARVAGIAQRPERKTKEEEPADLLAFHCTGKRCGHHWVTGRGVTSSEQICKCCGESVVGVPSKGSIFCEIDQEAATSAGEVVKIRLEQHVAPGWATLELEDRLVDFVRSEVRFISQFFDEDGVRDYVAYRQGKSLEGDEGRDRNKDALLMDSMCNVVDALCKAEFTGSLRAGEADAKLQALLKGQMKFSVLCAPEREKRGALVTAEVDFDIELDVEDRIADKADARLQRLRKVMSEMDKKVRDRAETDRNSSALQHPRQLLAKMISGLDWRRGISDQVNREGHDRVRCMTCRFLGEDCSADIARSKDVRVALRLLPSFLFTTRMVCRKDGNKDWQSFAGDLLEGVAQSKGSECLIRAEPKQDGLHLQLFSQADWLHNAAERLCALAAESKSLTLSSLVGVGRSARGLHVEWERTCEAVEDVPGFLRELWAGTSGAPVASVAPVAPVASMLRWCQSSVDLDVKCSPVAAKAWQEARRTFGAYANFGDWSGLMDFLRDFRQKGAAHAKPVPRPRPTRPVRPPASEPKVSRHSRSRSASHREARGRAARRSPSYGAYRGPEVASSGKKRRRRSSS